MCTRPSITSAAAAAAKAPGTASRGAKRVSSSQVPTIGAVKPGYATSERAGDRHTGKSTPANSALASGAGIAVMSRSKRRETPASTVSPPETTKAPSAAGYPPCTCPAPISTAAPGVDQAMLSGIRDRQDSTMPSTPMPMLSVASPDADSARSAPIACSPASTTENEPTKPTSAATSPATIGCASLRLIPRSRSPTLTCAAPRLIHGVPITFRARAARSAT